MQDGIFRPALHPLVFGAIIQREPVAIHGLLNVSFVFDASNSFLQSVHRGTYLCAGSKDWYCIARISQQHVMHSESTRPTELHIVCTIGRVFFRRLEE